MGNTRERVEWLMQQQDGCCYWCRFILGRDDLHAAEIVAAEAMAANIHDRRMAIEQIVATFDHFVPRALGGANSRDNGVAACRWCNEWRGREPAWSFRDRVDHLVADGQHPRQIFRSTGLWLGNVQKTSIRIGYRRTPEPRC